MSFSAINIERLNRENFDTWKIQVEAILIKNGTWKYVNGSCIKPEAPPEAVNEWIDSDAKARSDLILSISPTELQQIKQCRTSKEIWDKLHSVYQSRGPARQAMLLKSLILHKMTPGDDMHEHLRKFFDIVDKLVEMDMVVIDELLTILLLYSIPNEYETFRIAIETQEKLPKLELLKVKLLEEFEARKRHEEADPEDVLYANRRNLNKSRGRPPNTAREDQQKQSFKYACHTCGKIGHKARDCKSKNFKHRKPQQRQEQNYSSCKVEEIVLGASSVNMSGRWCLDSGASSHMCALREKFRHFKTLNGKTLALANESFTKIEGRGIVEIKSNTGCNVTLNETLYVPDLRTNLLSVPKMTQHGLEVTFTGNKAIVKNASTGARIFVAERKENLYYVEEPFEFTAIANMKPTSLQDWHEAFGHLNEKDLKAVIDKKKVIGINANTKTNLTSCSTCIQGKQTQKPFQKSTREAIDVLELVHSDVCGPMKTQSFAGSRYFLTFIDDKSRWCEIYFLKHKSEVLEKFKEYKRLMENQSGKKIKCLRSDNGTEYTSNAMRSFLKAEGIRQEFTIEYTPQQNGVAERKNRTIVEMARCMLIQSGLPPAYWAEAINTANYLRNRCPSQSLNGEVPYQIWMGRTPHVSYLQKFGCTAYMLDKTASKCKFNSKSIKCIFVGYCDTSKGYRLWDPVARKIRRSRDVVFVPQQNIDTYEEFLTKDIEIHSQLEQTKEKAPVNFPESQQQQPQSTRDLGVQAPRALKRGRGRRKKIKIKSRGRPRLEYNMVPVFEMSTSDENSTSDPEAVLEDEHHSTALAHSTDPETSKEALSSPEATEWKKAMIKEYRTLMSNNTWEIVDRPVGKKIVQSKWAFRTKYKSDGSVDTRKARLVAKGFTQRAGIDYNETFAPVARLNTIRLLIAFSAEMGLEVHQLDFVSAYLNGTVENEIYMTLPSDLHEILSDAEASQYTKDNACLLKKAIYGLKQSGRLWYQKLAQKLQNMNMTASKCDPCLYMYRSKSTIALIAIYVDDIIVASNNKQKLDEIKNELASTFEMKDLGPIKFCLGIEFNQCINTKTITMCQSKYVSQLLKKFNMEECKPVATPANASIKLSKAMSPKTEEERNSASKLPFQNLVGSLMYLAVSTRSDIQRIADNKAPGLDGLPNVAVKAAIKSTPEVFAKLYNTCLNEGVFPKVWKLQRLVLLL